MAVLDQTVFSGANFIISIFLARLLSPEEFGGYTLGSSLLILFYQIYVSFLLDPMTVLGPLNYSEKLNDYFSWQLLCHITITLISGIILISLAMFWTTRNILIQQVLLTVGITLPVLLLPWYFRRVFYILGKLDNALIGSLIYALMLVILTVLLYKLNKVTGYYGILIMAGASMICSLYYSIVLGLWKHKWLQVPFRKILSQNWQIGKWLVLSGFFIAFASQIQIWISNTFFGLDISASFRAFQVITQPMMLIITTLTTLSIPSLAIDYFNKNFRDYYRKMFLLSSCLFFLSIIFEILFITYNTEIEIFVYNGKYSKEAYFLPILGIVPIILAYTSGLQAGFQAVKRPQAILIASINWFLVSSILGVRLSLTMGIIGLVWSAVFGYLYFALVLSFLYLRWIYIPYAKNKALEIK